MSQGTPDPERLMRMLGPGDETRLEDFLAAHADSSMSLLGFRRVGDYGIALFAV